MIKIKRNPLTNETRVVKMSKHELLLHSNCDPFPCRFSDKIDKLNYPKKFKNLLGNKNIQMFIAFMEKHDTIVHFKLRHMEQKHETHLPMVGNGSKSVSEFRPNIDFLRMANRLRRTTNVNLRENVDVRLFFRCENTFLVKAFFTFGLRNVEIGTAHIYQTLNVPLLFYVKNRFSTEKKATRQFPYGELCKYQRLVLSPNKCFRIPPGTTYLILSTQKNYFSVDIVPENYRIEIEYEDPLIKRVSKFHDPYAFQIQTPFIDHLNSEREESTFFIPESPAVVRNPEQISNDGSQKMETSNDYSTLNSKQQMMEPSNDYSILNSDNAQQQMMETSNNYSTLNSDNVQQQQMMETSNNYSTLNSDNAQQQMMETQQQITYLLIPQTLPILEKNIVVSDAKFVENYQKLKFRETTSPIMPAIRPSEDDIEPMDLSHKKTELDQLFESLRNDEVKNLDEIIQSLGPESMISDNDFNDLLKDICSP